MLIQCSVCKRIRRFGLWIGVSDELAKELANIPVTYLLCDKCKGVNGGCERLRTLERKFKTFDSVVSIGIACMAISVLIAVLVVLFRWANS